MTLPVPGSRFTKSILFLEQYYFPEGWGGAELPRQLTMHLSSKGYDVEVICGSGQYAPVEGAGGVDPRNSGVRIRRIPDLISGDIRRLKLLRQIWFYAAVVPVLLFRRRPCLLFQQTNPPLLVVICALAARLWRRPLAIIAMDLYPEVIVASGSLRGESIAARLLSSVFSWAYRSASVVVSLGPVMSQRLRTKGVMPSSIIEIPNWSTGAPNLERGPGNPLRRELNLAGCFVVLYSGNLGVAHEFDTFLEGFAAAAFQFPRLRLVIVGKGSRLGEVQARVAQLRLSGSVHFSGFVPSEQLPQTMGLADLALVTLREGFEGLVVPSKLYSYLERGIPVLYVGPTSDTSIAVTVAGAGKVVAPRDSAAVAAILLQLASDPLEVERLGAAGKAEYDARMTMSHAMARYDTLVQACLQKG